MGLPLLARVARDAALGVIGVPVLIAPAEGDPYTVSGHFDDDHREIRGDGDAGYSTSGPMVSLAADRLQAELVPDDDELEVRGQRYVIVDIQPDGQGTLDLVLRLLDDDAEEDDPE